MRRRAGEPSPATVTAGDAEPGASPRRSAQTHNPAGCEGGGVSDGLTLPNWKPKGVNLISQQEVISLPTPSHPQQDRLALSDDTLWGEHPQK